MTCIAVSLCGTECPDGTYCGSKETCCEMTDGSYGCCPYKNAVCCEDKSNCCPNGYICNLKQQSCDTSISGFLAYLLMMDLTKLQSK